PNYCRIILFYNFYYSAFSINWLNLLFLSVAISVNPWLMFFLVIAIILVAALPRQVNPWLSFL
ncbi:MAG: hypothetical protein ACE5IR_11575, partial [bacterium]